MRNDEENRYSTVAPEVSNAYDFAVHLEETLSAPRKSISCIYFYDQEGSKLFEEICELPEYYLTRAETEILQKYAGEIISGIAKNAALIELGSGSSLKTRYLIEAMLNTFNDLTYYPIDISESMLHESAGELLKTYKNLNINSIAAPYDIAMDEIKNLNGKAKLIIWLGSSIGNFDRKEAADFLNLVSANMNQRDHILIGMDLHKDRKILEDAYNDSQGITAKFNLNVLQRINTELGGRFDLNQFKHLAQYNAEKDRIEMYLVSKCDQEVFIKELDRTFSFSKGEKIHTENSYKYSRTDIQQLGAKANLDICGQWFDKQERFSLNLFRKNGYS